MFTPLPQTKARRRLYLMRHSEVSYCNPDGTLVSDSEEVVLTERGRGQAGKMAELLAEISFDRVLCSGMPRTIETASIASQIPDVKIEIWPGFREIREGDLESVPEEDRLERVVYHCKYADLPDARFAGGDRYDEFCSRVISELQKILQSLDWSHLLLVAHGTVNRALLSYLATGSIEGALSHLDLFEQDPGCLNIIDVDMNGDQTHKFLLRSVNFTPYDPSKKTLTLTSGEAAYQEWLGPF